MSNLIDGAQVQQSDNLIIEEDDDDEDLDMDPMNDEGDDDE